MSHTDVLGEFLSLLFGLEVVVAVGATDIGLCAN
jgi:hypothetical protein